MAFTMSMGGSIVTGNAIPGTGTRECSCPSPVKFYESRRFSFLDPVPRPLRPGNLVTKGSRRYPVFFGGIGHGHNPFTTQCTYASSAKAARGGAVYDDDDEPMEPPPEVAEVNGMLIFMTHLEYPAIPNDEEREGFAVMLHVKAPSLVSGEPWRPPVDLVMVLDAGVGMAGAKLEQVKRAMAFVVDNLGPRDRLSVVSFDSGSGARRVTRLTRMSDDGKAAAKRAVESLATAAAGSGTANVRGGLDEAAKVLHCRRHDNSVAAVILLTDGGQDFMTSADDYSLLVPKFLVDNPMCRRTPVHTFVLGSDDHDTAEAAAAMHHISEATGGTFSFVEDHAAVHGALARCVGGLRSLAAQHVSIKVECTYPTVRFRAFKSGGYESKMDDWDWDRDWDWLDQEFKVKVGDLYADEERRFLLFLDVESADGAPITTFMKITCSYWDVVTEQDVTLESDGYYVDRPLDAGDAAPSLEVKRELLRVAAAEDMAVARDAAERGDYAEVARVLDARREMVSRSPPAVAGDPVCGALVAQLQELSLRMADEREYKRRGRASLLAGVSAHARQRGLLGIESGRAGSGMFATPAMRKMEKLSEMIRERQRQEQATSAPPEKGIEAFPRPRLEARLAAAAPRLSMLRRYRHLLPLIKR